MNTATKKIQVRQTFEAFKERPKTMLQVSIETGILRGNICRYVAHFKKRKLIAQIKKSQCPVSKHQAVFYSTDPALIPKPGQSELFKNEGCRV